MLMAYDKILNEISITSDWELRIILIESLDYDAISYPNGWSYYLKVNCSIPYN